MGWIVTDDGGTIQPDVLLLKWEFRMTMLIFIDTEFTDFIDCELISIGMVSEDGQYMCYVEVQDFDRAKCNSFVQAAVWPQLGQIEGATVPKHALQNRLSEWLASLPGDFMLACDSQYDRDLLADALDDRWPANFQGWFDLRPAMSTEAFGGAMAGYHSAGHPWHHALHDAYAHRMGWIAWKEPNA